jgi:hypothetical protein
MAATYFDAGTEVGGSPRGPITTLADTVKDLRARGVVWPVFERRAAS